MKCEDWQELLLDQESLDDLQRGELHQHLAGCTGCRSWAKALAETETVLMQRLNSQVIGIDLRPFVLEAVALHPEQSEQSWMAVIPELLEGLGWGALGVLGAAGFILWTNLTRLDNHLVWLGAAAVAGSVAWAGNALRREESEARLAL